MHFRAVPGHGTGIDLRAVVVSLAAGVSARGKVELTQHHAHALRFAGGNPAAEGHSCRHLLQVFVLLRRERRGSTLTAWSGRGRYDATDSRPATLPDAGRGVFDARRTGMRAGDQQPGQVARASWGGRETSTLAELGAGRLAWRSSAKKLRSRAWQRTSDNFSHMESAA